MLAISSQTEGRHQYQLHMCFLDFSNEIGQIFEETWSLSQLCTIFQASKAILCPQPSPTASPQATAGGSAIPWPHFCSTRSSSHTRHLKLCQVGKVKVFSDMISESVAKSRSQADFAHSKSWSPWGGTNWKDIAFLQSIFGGVPTEWFLYAKTAFL